MPNAESSPGPGKFTADGVKAERRRKELRQLRAAYRSLPYRPYEGGKVCVSCEKKLPEVMFSCSVVHGRRYHHGKCIVCRGQFIERSVSGRAKRKLIDELRDHPCADCGGRFPPVVMRFYPMQGPSKFCIKNAWTGRAARAIIAEASKCEIVCSNCSIQRRRKAKAAAGPRAPRVAVRPWRLADLPPELRAKLDLHARLEELTGAALPRESEAVA